MKRLLRLIVGLFLAGSAYGAVPSFESTTNIVNALIAGLLGPTNGVTALTATNIAQGEVNSLAVRKSGDSMTGGLTNGTGIYGNGIGLSNTLGTVSLIRPNAWNRNFFASSDTDVARGLALSNVITLASPGDTISIGPGGYYMDLGNILPTNNLTIEGRGNPVLWMTNAANNPTVSAPALIRLRSGLTLRNIVLSNSVDNPAGANIYSYPITTRTNDPASTNFLVTGCSIYGVSDGVVLWCTNGPHLGRFEHTMINTRWDVFGEIADTYSGGKIVFDDVDFISTNALPGIAAKGLAMRMTDADVYNCRFKIDSGTNGVANATAFSVNKAGNLRMRVFNSTVNVVATNSPFDMINNMNYLGQPAQLTNLIYGNVVREDGGPLRISTTSGAFIEKKDNSTIVAVNYDSGDKTADISNASLMTRQMGALFRVTVNQKCTTSGSSGTLHTTVTMTDSSENDIVLAPAPDLTLNSTTNSCSGSVLFRAGNYDPNVSTTTDVLLNSAITGGIGTPHYQLEVIIEQVGSN